jgi:hypothetical protein
MYIAKGNASMPRHCGGRTGNISGVPEDATGRRARKSRAGLSRRGYSKRLSIGFPTLR